MTIEEATKTISDDNMVCEVLARTTPRERDLIVRARGELGRRMAYRWSMLEPLSAETSRLILEAAEVIQRLSSCRIGCPA